MKEGKGSKSLSKSANEIQSKKIEMFMEKWQSKVITYQ